MLLTVYSDIFRLAIQPAIQQSVEARMQWHLLYSLDSYRKLSFAFVTIVNEIVVLSSGRTYVGARSFGQCL